MEKTWHAATKKKKLKVTNKGIIKEDCRKKELEISSP